MLTEFIIQVITSASVSVALSGLLVWLTKSWISERLKHAIKAEYDEKLETHKAQLRAHSDVELGGCPRIPFSPNSALRSKNYPRNINHMPAVIFFASLDFGKNCYSRTAS